MAHAHGWVNWLVVLSGLTASGWLVSLAMAERVPKPTTPRAQMSGYERRLIPNVRICRM
jgi:hypothetical protein